MIPLAKFTLINVSGGEKESWEFGLGFSKTVKITSNRMRPKKLKVEKRELSKRKGFKFTSWCKEDHKEPIFGVAFNPYNHPDHPPVFATVGSNRVTIYECTENSINVIQSYSDPCTEEIFYTVCWVYSKTEENEKIETMVAIAGLRGLIRVVSLKQLKNLFTLMGCGDSINEVKLHPKDNNLLLSASKDNSLRLWNLKTRRCILIFGGLEGHRDEVLSCDFDLNASYVLSCGMDHSVKMWSLESDDVKDIIESSYTYSGEKPFPVLNKHFPVFSTRNIHRNYVDCVRWFGNFVLSKSCENKIMCWKPNLSVKKSSDIPDQSEVLHSFEYGNCDIWYMRFAVSPNFDAIAAGNQIGKVFLWDISEEPGKPAILSHQKCSTAIRQVCFSPDSTIMVAVSDDSSMWRWDKEVRPTSN
ncbi:hypothetical protein ACHWQZ_G015270 [Mnemiopsis leidyi]